MGTIFDEPTWQFRGTSYNGDECLETFRGARAFNDARYYLDQMKAYEKLCELWLIRLDGNDWNFQEHIRRNANGEWEQITYDVPTGMRPDG
jgi:hypothetical protein